MKADGMLGNSEPDGAGLSGGPPLAGHSRVDGAALPRIDRLTMLCLGALAFLLQLFLSTETQVGFALIDQTLGMLAVDIQTFGLAIGHIRAAQVWSFIPVKAQPFEVGDELVFIAGFAAFDVRVLDAEHHRPTALPGKKPVEEGSARIANMQLAGWRRSKTNADRGVGGHQKMLADHHSPRRGRCPTCPGGAKLRDRAYLGDARKEQHQANGGGQECPPHTWLRSPCRRHVGSGDAVVPAELVFVEEAPGVAEPER